MGDNELIKRMGQNLDSSNYTDEELLEHINLEEPYTETELMETLKIITDMFGSSTSGYSGNSRISLNSSSNMLGNNTSGYVGNPRTSINSINTGLSCFWNC